VDKDRLTKLMQMTTSDHDGEALNALRMANKMLDTEKVTWGEILAAGRTINIGISYRHEPETRSPAPYKAEEPWQPPHLHDKAVIDLMFRTIYARPRTGNDGFWEFIDSVHQWYLDKGWLTQSQYNAIRRSYKR
jgi:hypothetical protein